MGRIDTEELREATIKELTRRHVIALRTLVLTGHAQTLSSLSEDLAHRMSQPGVTEQLVRMSLSVGPVGLGQSILALIEKDIEAAAEVEAIKEVERMEADPDADPNAYRPTLRQVRRHGEVALNA